jgi:hypothetical protein
LLVAALNVALLALPDALTAQFVSVRDIWLRSFD